MAKKNKKSFSGNKYKKAFQTTDDGFLDVYCVADAFDVQCSALTHALKKILMPGQRGKGSKIQDLKEAVDAVTRAIQMERNRRSDKSKRKKKR